MSCLRNFYPKIMTVSFLIDFPFSFSLLSTEIDVFFGTIQSKDPLSNHLSNLLKNFCFPC